MASGRHPTFSQLRGLDRRIWVLAAVRAVNTAGLSLAMAFIGIYLVTDRGRTGVLFGSIYLVANLCQSLSQGLAGPLSDRIGRVPMMIWGLVARAFVLTALGIWVVMDAPIWLIGATLVVSLTLRGVVEPAAYAAVADVAAPGQRTAAYALQRMGTNIGWALGPAAGGFLADSFGYGAAFFCAAPALFLAAIAVSRLEEPTRSDVGDAQSPGQRRRQRRESGVYLFLGCAFLFAICHSQVFATLSFFATGTLELGKPDVGLIFALNGVLVIALQVPAVVAIRRVGERTAVVLGSSLYVAAFLLIGGATTVSSLALCMAVFTCGEVMLAPAQQSLNAELGDPRRLGRAFGALGLVMMLGVSVSPLIGGGAYDLMGESGQQMWSSLAALPAAMTLGYLLFGLRFRRSPTRAQRA